LRVLSVRQRGQLEEAWLRFASETDWDYRLDLTFRYGTEQCSREHMSVWKATRCASDFLIRLGSILVGGFSYLGVLEGDGEFKRFHWHILISPSGKGRLTKRLIDKVWQIWREWPEKKQHLGLEGLTWCKYLNTPERRKEGVGYAVKYVLKNPAELLIGEIKPSGLWRGSE